MASGALAQLNMNDVFDEGKDLIIQQSLGSFGSSLGSQVPVLIDHKSAYSTVRYLSGKAFAPKSTPAVANALRASRDGTAMLPPGDYAFPVDVFCMRANAESPNGYQYHIAPLHGSAADIITVLNARAPSSGIAHGVLQVLEWNIQGGVPYAGMAAPERAAIDKVIPEFRSRFNGKSSADLAKQYATLARSIPGMPALEQALQRIGPIGNAMSNINTLQHQLAAHPQEFDQLSRVLVPLGAAAGSPAQSTTASRATPWSRYSDQVYVRFITSGNFATPGTYQVRVTGPHAAPVPFSNIVADSGSDKVQSLTIALRTPVGSKPLPPPPPYIISVTVSKVPDIPDSRTTVGVAEPVVLTFSAGEANWSLESNGGTAADKLDDGHLTIEHGTTTRYVAATTNHTETVKAEGAGGKKASITFTVIAPTGVKQVVDPRNPLIHHYNKPDVGFWAQTYIEPANVSFQWVGIREGDVCPTAAGVYLPEIHGGHQPAVSPAQVGLVVAGLGSLVDGHDQNWSGDPTSPYAFTLGNMAYAPGFLNFHIPWYYSLPSGKQEHKFAYADAHFELGPDGRSMVAYKAGSAHVTATVQDDTVGMMNPVGASGTPKEPAPAPLVCP